MWRPGRLTFVSAGLISVVIGVPFMPWLWMDNAATIFAVLADFYPVRRRNYDLVLRLHRADALPAHPEGAAVEIAEEPS